MDVIIRSFPLGTPFLFFAGDYMPNEIEQFKTCNKCLKSFPATTECFYARETKLRSYCKECYKKTIKTNYENTKKSAREYYHKHKDERAKYYLENRERLIKYSREYHKKIKNTFKYKEKQKIKLYARLARGKSLKHSFRLEQWIQCLQYFNHKCCYCGSAGELQHEHFIPLAKGGEYTKGNIVPACGPCNKSKGKLDFLVWYKKQPFYSLENETRITRYLNL